MRLNEIFLQGDNGEDLLRLLSPVEILGHSLLRHIRPYLAFLCVCLGWEDFCSLCQITLCSSPSFAWRNKLRPEESVEGPQPDPSSPDVQCGDLPPFQFAASWCLMKCLCLKNGGTITGS